MEYWFTPNKKRTGSWIKYLREEKKLSASAVGLLLGDYSDRTIYKWEAGKSYPSLENILKLSIILDSPVQEIMVPLSLFVEDSNDSYGEQLVKYTDYLLKKASLSWLSTGETNFLDSSARVGFWRIKLNAESTEPLSPTKWLTDRLVFEFGPTYKANLDRGKGRKVILRMQELIEKVEAPSQNIVDAAMQLGLLPERYLGDYSWNEGETPEEFARKMLATHFNLTKNLASRLEDIGSTPKECAIAIGVSESSISQWQSGYAFPKTEKLALLYSYLGYAMDNPVLFFPARCNDKDFDILQKFSSMLRDADNEGLSKFIATLDPEERKKIVHNYLEVKSFFDTIVINGPDGLVLLMLRACRRIIGLQTSDGVVHKNKWWVNEILRMRDRIWSSDSGIVIEGISGCAFELIGSNYDLWKEYLMSVGRSEVINLISAYKSRGVNDSLIYGLLLVAKEEIELKPKMTDIKDALDLIDDWNKIPLDSEAGTYLGEVVDAD